MTWVVADGFCVQRSRSVTILAKFPAANYGLQRCILRFALSGSVLLTFGCTWNNDVMERNSGGGGISDISQMQNGLGDREPLWEFLLGFWWFLGGKQRLEAS